MADNSRTITLPVTLSALWGSRVNEMMIMTHTSLLVFFWMSGVYPMVWVNVVSLLVYFSEFKILEKSPEAFLGVFVSEVIVHMLLAIAYTGWDCGFQYYAFAMAPVTYFADHIVRNEGGRTTHPLFFSSLSIVAYLSGRIVSANMEPICPVRSDIAFWAKTVNGVMILGMLMIFSKIYVQRILEIENELVTNAEFDELTKLPNRHFLDRMLEEKKIGKTGGVSEYAVAILDIDNFKKVNDRFGHLAGDQVLKKLAGILARTAGEDVFAGRWGGEEFMMVVTGPDCYDKLVELTEDVRRQLENTVVHFDYWQIVVTCSIGVASTPDSMNFKDLVEVADKCLYEAKGSGKNKVIGKEG